MSKTDLKIRNNASALRSVGLKVTPARLEIMEVFSTTKIPLRAEDVYKSIDRKKTDLVTVYRNLISLVDKKVLRKVDLRKDATYYEFAKDHHHHIICTDCGSIEDFEICDIGKISEKILKESNKFSVIEEHSLEFFGLCKSCSGR